MPIRTTNKNDQPRRVLARVAPEDFVGRADALQQLSALSTVGANRRGVLLLAAPTVGATELLRQAYDAMFHQRGGASPVYFAFSRSDHTTTGAARRFLHTFLWHVVAHRRADATLIDAPPALHDLLELAAPSDYEWIERLIQSYERARGGSDERGFVRLCLSAPQHAATRGSHTVVMLDDVHLATQLKGEVALGEEVAQAFTDSDEAFVLSGLRRSLLGVLQGASEVSRLNGTRKIHLERLDDAEARTLLERVARNQQVVLTDESRDLLVQQLEGNPFFITTLVQAAQNDGGSLASYLDCQRLYVDELLGGRINRRFKAVLEEIAPAAAARRTLLRLLRESESNPAGKSPAEAWRKRLELDAESLARVMAGLHVHELGTFDTTYVEVGANLVWRDYLHASYRLQVSADPRALVVADTLVEALKRAPQTMERHYRRASALQLRQLLGRFDSQRVPASLLHHDRFARMYKGVGADEVLIGLDTETDLIRLPQIVHAASCAAFHPPMQLICDEERCAVAHGFDAASYSDTSEVVWLAAELESKLEVGRALTEVWCDRLAQLAHSCGFTRTRLLLVSTEGFSAEACELLNEREAFSASHQQLELLTARVSPALSAQRLGAGRDEFEMVIPMGDDTELIAAHTVEQIARRLDFQPEAINQIKTALVEACINAAEHSLSPDRKIYQRFRVESDKLVVTVSSRGVAVSASASQNGEAIPEPGQGSQANGSAKGRRGWGLKLIRTLMDEVEFERVDDGTRLRMTKYLRK